LQQGSKAATTNSPLCILSIGWRCNAAAARLEEFNPLDMASAGLRITGIELLMLSVVYFRGYGTVLQSYCNQHRDDYGMSANKIEVIEFQERGLESGLLLTVLVHASR